MRDGHFRSTPGIARMGIETIQLIEPYGAAGEPVKEFSSDAITIM